MAKTKSIVRGTRISALYTDDQVRLLNEIVDEFSTLTRADALRNAIVHYHMYIVGRHQARTHTNVYQHPTVDVGKAIEDAVGEVYSVQTPYVAPTPQSSEAALRTRLLAEIAAARNADDTSIMGNVIGGTDMSSELYEELRKALHDRWTQVRDHS